MSPQDWAQLVFTGIAGLFGLFSLFDGARRLAAHGPNPSGRRMIGVGMAIVMMLAGYSFWKHRTLVDVGRAYQPIELGKELPDDWNRKMSPAKREAQSLALARGIYVNTGRMREYFDANAKRVRFVPGEAEIKQRETQLAKAQQIQQDAHASFVDFVMWLVWGVAALLLGPLFAREPVAQPAEAEPEAEITPSPVAPPAAPKPMPPAPAVKPTVVDDTIPLPKPAGTSGASPKKS
jgi:hypothetical protein